MFMDQNAFRFSGKLSRLASRELNGFDEQSVCSLDTPTAIGLLDRLLVRTSGSPSEHLKAADLTAAERDRLLAAVYKRTFGPRIESTVRCTFCGNPFDLTFSIDDLLAAFRPAALSSAASPGSGWNFPVTRWSSFSFANRRRRNGGGWFTRPTGATSVAAKLHHRIDGFCRHRCRATGNGGRRSGPGL